MFSPSEYSSSGHRIYNDTDILRLHEIMALKELGLSLEEIKSVIAGEEYDLLKIISLQMSRLKDKIQIQQKLLKELQNLSSLLEAEDQLTVENFTSLLKMMKHNHEKYFTERRKSAEHHLDKLEEYLIFHSK